MTHLELKALHTTTLLLCLLMVYGDARGEVKPERLHRVYHNNNRYDVRRYDTVCPRENYVEVMRNFPAFYFRGLTRIMPYRVGEKRIITIEGRDYIIITRALRPPIYEILDYLSDEECDTLIKAALSQTLMKSRTRSKSDNAFDPQTAEENKEKIRVSDQTWLAVNDIREEYRGTLLKIKERLINMTGLPRTIIEDSEAMQVARYRPGGHYHAHMDTTEYRPDKHKNLQSFLKLECCFHKHKTCFKEDNCCKLCRYMTVMYYLSNVDEGGQTAFLNAKLRPGQMDKKNMGFNLSYNCSDANLVITPRKGSAILWYNHHIDPYTGWLGKPDTYTFHGGCDVIKGEKWIGNNWINVPTYRGRLRHSKYGPYPDIK